WPLIALGFAALVLAIALRRERRLPIALVLAVALLMAATLFTVTGASAALRLLRTPFVVARLSTVLSMLLFFGIAASLAALTRSRRAIEALLSLAVVALASRVLGQAPIPFDEHVGDALAAHAQRHALLDQLEARRQMLARSVPSGTIVLTTARFARQLVMLRDCYVLAADRGHTGVPGIDRRRRDLFILNAADTSWSQRERLIARYDLHLVTFEQRWERRYRWAFEHGHLRDRAAGLDVVELDRAP
ncbi:MAG TPA: hypothetical protein VHZ95_00170, partial [Polyangiales bacterium]|nr:hypothetical protein [Polyangiales bacterium]